MQVTPWDTRPLELPFLTHQPKVRKSKHSLKRNDLRTSTSYSSPPPGNLWYPFRLLTLVSCRTPRQRPRSLRLICIHAMNNVVAFAVLSSRLVPLPPLPPSLLPNHVPTGKTSVWDCDTITMQISAPAKYEQGRHQLDALPSSSAEFLRHLVWSQDKSVPRGRYVRYVNSLAWLFITQCGRVTRTALSLLTSCRAPKIATELFNIRIHSAQQHLFTHFPAWRKLCSGVRSVHNVH